jgi:hypothetical protein
MLLSRHDWNFAFGALIPATLLRSMRGAHRCSQSRQGGGGAWLEQSADGIPSKPTRAEAREGFDSQERVRSKSDSFAPAERRRIDTPPDGSRFTSACDFSTGPLGAKRYQTKAVPEHRLGDGARRNEIEIGNAVPSARNRTRQKTEPNKAMEPIPVDVTDCAGAHSAPSTSMAHL